MVARHCIPDFSTFGCEHAILSATLGEGGLLTGALSDSEKPSESTCCTGSSPWSKTITEASAETLERAVKRLIVEKVDMEMAKVTHLVQISVQRESQSLRDQMAALRQDLAALQGSARAAGSQAKAPAHQSPAQGAIDAFEAAFGGMKRLDTLAHTTRGPKSTAERPAPAGVASGAVSTMPGLHSLPLPSGPPTVQGLHSALVGFMSQGPARPADGQHRAEVPRSPSKSSSVEDAAAGFVDDFNLDMITSSKPLPGARRAHDDDDDDDDFNLDMICSSKPLPGGGAGRRRGSKKLSFADDFRGGTQTPSLPSAACLSCMGVGCGMCSAKERHGASVGEGPMLSRMATSSAGLCMDCEGRGCGMCSRSSSTGRHGDKSLGHMTFRTPQPSSRDSHAANPNCLSCGGVGCGMCGSYHSDDPRHSFDVNNSWLPPERQQKKLQQARAGIKDNASKAVSVLIGGGGQSRRRRGKSAEVRKGSAASDFGARESADEFGGFLA